MCECVCSVFVCVCVCVYMCMCFYFICVEREREREICVCAFVCVHFFDELKLSSEFYHNLIFYIVGQKHLDPWVCTAMTKTGMLALLWTPF